MSSNDPIANNDLYSVLIAFLINSAISAGCFVAFSALRPVHKAIYEPKAKYAEMNKRPEAIGNKPWDWVTPLWRFDEVSQLEKNGMDATMFLRFVGFAAKLFGFMTIFSIPLMSIHFYSLALDDIDPNATKNTDILKLSLNRITIGNVSKGSNIFYIHALLAYLYTALAIYLLNNIWMEYIEMRKVYLDSDECQNSYNNRIILFTGIPENKKSLVFFTEYLNAYNLDQKYDQILLGRDYSDLQDMVEKHLDLTEKFEKVLMIYLNDPKNVPVNRPTHRVGGFLCYGGSVVDSIDYYRTELLQLEERIYTERSKLDSEFKSDHSCFVQYKDYPSAHAAAEAMHNPLKSNVIYTTLKNTPDFKLCPAFDDIIWENIGVGPVEKKSRRLIALGMTVGITIGWTAFVALSQGVAELGTYVDSPVGAMLTAFMGPLIASLCNVLLPHILRIVCRLQGVVSKSGIEKSALYKYFLFQIYQLVVRIGMKIVTVFIQILISGKSDKQIADTFLRDFISSFSSLSTFYVSFIAGGYTFYGIEIIQGGPLIINFLKKRCLTNTPRQEYELGNAPFFNFMPIYGYSLLIFLVGSCYSLISPLIVPFAALTFGMAYFAWKYQIYYVYRTEYETGGLWWPKVFNMICVSLILFQTTTFGALVVQGALPDVPGIPNGSRIPNVLIFPLPFVTLAFWIYVEFKVRPKSEFAEKQSNEIATKHHPRYDADLLKNKVYNPAVFKLLPKVWLKPEMKNALSQIYTPQYTDVLDFVAKKNPAKIEELQKAENIRQIHRNESLRNRTVGRRPLSQMRDLKTDEEIVQSPLNQPDEEEPPEIRDQRVYSRVGSRVGRGNRQNTR